VAAWLLGLVCLPSAADESACIPAAAAYHRVNTEVLRAVLTVESGLNPAARHHNGNGTVDLGIGQINSTHWPELARYGVKPAHLLDACTGSYVAAWHLARQMQRFGNTWYAVGAYHSQTLALNQRYQTLVYRQLMRGTTAARQTSRPGLPAAAPRAAPVSAPVSPAATSSVTASASTPSASPDSPLLALE